MHLWWRGGVARWGTTIIASRRWPWGRGAWWSERHGGAGRQVGRLGTRISGAFYSLGWRLGRLGMQVETCAWIVSLRISIGAGTRTQLEDRGRLATWNMGSHPSRAYGFPLAPLAGMRLPSPLATLLPSKFPSSPHLVQDALLASHRGTRHKSE